jgi:hypothetical protein
MSCQGLILASPGGNRADVMRVWVDVLINTDAGRYQIQALV